MVVLVMFFIGNIHISFYHIKLNGYTFTLSGLKRKFFNITGKRTLPLGF